MTTWNEGRMMTVTAGEDLARYRRIKLSAGAAVYADAADSQFVGFTVHAAATGSKVAVVIGNCEGTALCTAAGTIASGAAVHPANDGKVAASGSVPAIGYAMRGAAKDGDFIEVLPWPITATADHETRIGANRADIATAQADISNHETRIGANRADIATAQADISNHETRIGANRADIATAQADITTLEVQDTLTLTAGETLVANRLVLINTGKVHYADSTDAASVIGITTAGAEADAEVSVKRINGNGAFKIEALDAFAMGAPVYLVNDGKIDDAGTTVIGIALEAASVAGDLVDVAITL